MPTRITGLATGMDIDSYVKAEMTAYKVKVDTKQKQKEVLEIKQEMYRDLINKGSDMWGKYFDRLKDGSLLSSSTYVTTKFTSSDENAVTAQMVSGNAIRDNYSVTVMKLAEAPKVVLNSKTLDEMKKGDKKELKFTVGEKEVSIDISFAIDLTSRSEDERMDNLTSELNEKLDSLNMKAVYSQITGGVIIKSQTTGEKSEFTMSGTGIESLDKKYSGVDAEYVISNSNGSKTGKSSVNNVTFDGVRFSFNKVSEIEKSDEVSTDTEADKSGKAESTAIKYKAYNLTYKNDANKLADKIIEFFNDYNKFIEEANTYLNDKHDRNFQPLTAEQKKEMSEDEIKLWNEKVKKGQLHRDSTVNIFISKLKSAMSNLVTGSDISLKSIGIESIKDFENKNGTFSISKDKLVSALEEKPEEIMKFFISNYKEKKDTTKKDDTIKEVQVTNSEDMKKGLFSRMYNILYDNCKSFTESELIKKAGTSTFYSNASLTKEINKYAKKVAEMQKDLSRREQKLYSKYAKLETVMNKYNNQLSKIQSMFQS